MLISNGKKKIANPQIIPPNSCENFYSSRISVDKRFQKFKLHPDPLYPGPGLPQDGLQSQSYEYFKIKWQIIRIFYSLLMKRRKAIAMQRFKSTGYRYVAGKVPPDGNRRCINL